jgi:hypothetical protein
VKALTKLAPDAVLWLPFACFVLAALVEFRSPMRRPTLSLRTAEIVIGFSVSVALVLSNQLWAHLQISSDSLSWIMFVISLLICASGPFSKYGSKLALVLVVFGSIVLAVFWYFNRILT